MKKIILFSVSLVFGFATLIWIINFIGWQKVKLAFIAFNGLEGLIIVILSVLILAIGGLRWKGILQNQGKNIPFLSLFRIYLAGFSITFFAPILILGGETFKSYLLKEKHSIPWSKAMASVIIDRIIELTAYLLVILGGVVFLFSKSFSLGFSGITLGAILIVFLLGITFFYVKAFKKQSIVKSFWKLFNPKLENKEPLETEKEFFKFFKLKGNFFWKAILLSFLKCGLALTRVWFLILCLGKGLSFLPSLSVLGFSYLALAIPIPAALGTHEAFQAFAFNILGISVSFAPVFAMVLRGAEMIVALVGIFFFFRMGTRILGAILFKKIGNLLNNGNHNGF